MGFRLGRQGADRGVRRLTARMLPSDPLPDLAPVRWIRSAAAVVSVASFLAMTGAVLLGVAARYLRIPGFEWSFEAAAILFLWVSFAGVVVAELRGENVAFTTLVERLRPAFARAVAVLAVFAMLWFMVRFAESALAFAGRAGTSPTAVLRLPRHVQILPMLLAASALVVATAIRLWLCLRTPSRP